MIFISQPHAISYIVINRSLCVDVVAVCLREMKSIEKENQSHYFDIKCTHQEGVDHCNHLDILLYLASAAMVALEEYNENI